jgi:hypothetical protein
MAAQNFFGHFKNVQFQKVAKEFLKRPFKNAFLPEHAVKTKKMIRNVLA